MRIPIYFINSDGILMIQYIDEIYVVIGFGEKDNTLYPIGYEINI